MGFLFFKKANKSTELLQIEKFNALLDELLSIDSFISVKDYSFLKDQFVSTYNSFSAIRDMDMLHSFCKKNNVKKTFVDSFLFSYENLNELVSTHNKLFIKRTLTKEKRYLDGILCTVDPNIVLDDDQRIAVLTDEDYCLIIAGAGAGKTTTIAAKVKYLVDKKHVKPEDILIVSFTNKAVGELKERINSSLNIPCPITTFHSAGNAILRKKQNEKLNIVDDGFLFNTVRDYLLLKIKDSKMADNLILFFGSYFDMQYEGNDTRELLNSIIRSDFSTLRGNLNEYSYTYIDRSTKRKVTLNNEIVKSSQEVQIANFLYLNGIDYEYEPTYPYHIYMARKRYYPDFAIRQNGRIVYLEHFGISENGQNDRYTSEELEKYKKAIRDKIMIHKNHGTQLIYTFSKYNDGRSLTDHLEELLRDNGIIPHPRSSEEILNKLTHIQENKYISKMVYLICDFIKNFKTNGYTEDRFYEFKRTVKSARTELFLEICQECYLEYQKALSKNNAVDFQDMINDAARALKEVAELKEKLHFKYIIIDEYQDISRQRFNLAKELSKVTDAKIIAVGDDWQSIFAFSGSDVSLFTNFCEIMGYGAQLKIRRTYRNAQEIIDIAGGFIQKNDAQIKKSLISPKHIKDPVVIVSYDDSPKKWNEKATEGGPLNKMARALEHAIGEIVAEHGNNTSILLIGRYNYDGEMLSRTGAFEYSSRGSKVHCKKYPNVQITFLTAHSSKGLGYDNVIIINAKDAVYGFPSKIENDPIMKLVVKQSDEMDYAEERRLFYVALTRTKNRVYIIAPQRHPSQFVIELKQEYRNVVLKGDLSPEPHGLLTNKVCPICGYPLQRRHCKGISMNLWVCTNDPELCGFVTNNLVGGKMHIHKCDQCVDGYLIVKTKNGYPFLGCTNYTPDGRGCNNMVSQQDFSSSVSLNEITEIQVLDEEVPVSEDTNSFTIVNEVLFTDQESDTVDEDNTPVDGANNLAYFKDELLNTLATELREYAENRGKIEGIYFWKVLRKKDIVSLCKYLPTSKDFLYEKYIPMGKHKISKYGDDVIDIIRNFVVKHGLESDMIPVSSDLEALTINKDNTKAIKALSSPQLKTPIQEAVATVVDTCVSISKKRPFGVTMLVNVLRGGKNQKLISYGFDQIENYGQFHSISTSKVIELVEFLIDINVLYRTSGLYPTVRVNKDKSYKDITVSEYSILKEIIGNQELYAISQYQNSKDITPSNSDSETSTFDNKLYSRLKRLREKLSRERNVDLVDIAWSTVLVQLATIQPITEKQFLSIKRVSPIWFEKTGYLFLQEILDYLKDKYS